MVRRIGHRRPHNAIRERACLADLIFCTAHSCPPMHSLCNHTPCTQTSSLSFLGSVCATMVRGKDTEQRHIPLSLLALHARLISVYGVVLQGLDLILEVICQTQSWGGLCPCVLCGCESLQYVCLYACVEGKNELLCSSTLSRSPVPSKDLRPQ
jgi:hypothetical protein